MVSLPGEPGNVKIDTEVLLSLQTLVASKLLLPLFFTWFCTYSEFRLIFFLPFACSQTIWCNIWFSICARNSRTDESLLPPRHAINIPTVLYLTLFACIYLGLQTVWPCMEYILFAKSYCLNNWASQQVTELLFKHEPSASNMRDMQKMSKNASQNM